MIDMLIKQTLDEYQDKINSCKIPPYTSTYKINKPRGYEIWLEINEFYVYKIIYMYAGNKCSLQSHDTKIETNFIVQGKAEVLLEDDNGVLNSHIFEAGTSWTIPVGKKHRVIAITDYMSLEVSSPHLNDVIRYEDDNNRPSGKIEAEHV